MTKQKHGLLITHGGSLSMVPADSIQDMYKAIDCTCFELKQTRYPIGVWFDEEFLFKITDDSAQGKFNLLGTLLAGMLTGPSFPSIHGNMLFLQHDDKGDTVDMEPYVRRGLIGAIRYIEMTMKSNASMEEIK